jgi:hypothetical protein
VRTYPNEKKVTEAAALVNITMVEAVADAVCTR